jgi:molybdopterin-containing oxidoreductase family membrane subunit
MKAIGYGVLALLTAAGLGATAVSLAEGHAAGATTQHVPWGLWVALYIFLLGLSAGSFLLSTLVYVFGVRRLESAGPTALLQALGCLLLGGFLIVMDLGHPERIGKVLTRWNPTSVMAWMGLFYNAYVAIVVAELYLVLRPGLAARGGWTRRLTLGYERTDAAALARDRAWLKRLGILGIPVALIVHGGVGSIFAVAKARPGWFSGLLPILFLISALASGGALLAFLTAAFSRRPALARDLARIAFGILCVELLCLSSEILVTLYGNVPHESRAWRLTLFGPYWWVFWFVQLGGGFLAPLALLAPRRLQANLRALGAASLLMVLGLLGARMNLVIPPQIEPAFETLADAYHHERWAPGYFPGTAEWLVGLGTLAAGVWLYLLARRVLPLEPQEAA